MRFQSGAGIIVLPHNLHESFAFFRLPACLGGTRPMRSGDGLGPDRQLL